MSKCRLLLTATLLIAAVFVGVQEGFCNVPDGFALMAENSYLKLYMDRSTTVFVVEDKRTGTTWSSNPLKKSGFEEQFRIIYYTPTDERRMMNNYEDSIEHEQFEIIEIEDGVRVEYVLGEQWKDYDYVPEMIEEERFYSEILEDLKENDREFMLNLYELIYLEEIDDDYERIELDIRGLRDKERLFGDYTIQSVGNNLDDDEKERLIRLVFSRIMAGRNDVENVRDIRPEHLMRLRNNPTFVLRDDIIPWDREDLKMLVREKTGYTPEDKQWDHTKTNLDPPRPQVRVFSIPIEYRLQKDNFIVRIPVEDIQYPVNVEPVGETYGLRGVGGRMGGQTNGHMTDVFPRVEGGNRVTFPLHAIEVLRYFGVADTDQQGYILVPDGSGGLIDLHKYSGQSYGREIFGRDRTIPRNEKTVHQQQNHLPVFGMKKDQQAFLGIIEEGKALATVRVEVPPVKGRYDMVYSMFTLIPRGETVLATGSGEGGGRTMNIFQPRLSESNIKIRYMFMEDKEADYVGMAHNYRRYLIENYDLAKVQAGEDIPFYLELIGGIPTQKPVLGVPREVIQPLTRYNAVEKIIRDLEERGIKNIKLRYTGWLMGGVEHVYPSKLRFERSLGTRQEFIDMVDTLKQRGVELYPDVGFLNVKRTRILDDFNTLVDASRYLEASVARVYDFNLATFNAEAATARYVLSPYRLQPLVSDFLTDYTQYDLGGLSLRQMGMQVNSDFRDGKRLIDRQQSLDIITDVLQTMSSEYALDLMVDGGNEYILPYTKNIINMPLIGSYDNIVDRDIPFFQIAVHGLVNYAGEPINIAQNYNKNILRSIEAGAYPYYLWTYGESSLVKGTKYADLLGVYYKDWLDNAVDIYERTNEALRTTQDKKIVNHEKVIKDVYRTTFENGIVIITNHGEEPVNIDDFEIDGYDFKVLEGGQ